MKYIEEFLLLNNFKKIGDNKFINVNCEVEISNDIYSITDNEGSTMYSKDLNIYWLIGVLTYYEHIDRNYIKQYGV